MPLPTLDLGLPGWTLRAWRESDATALTLHANNPNVWRWMSELGRIIDVGSQPR